MSLEKEDSLNAQSENDNEKDKLFSKNKYNNNIKSSSEDGTNEINTVFELNEARVNCCNCKSCTIFWF